MARRERRHATNSPLSRSAIIACASQPPPTSRRSRRSRRRAGPPTSAPTALDSPRASRTAPPTSATVDGAVAAVLYTQRIASAAALNTFATQEDACVRASDGATLELLAVAALPSRHPLRLGVALRDFALEQAELDGVTREVVAMTRCSHYARRNAADGADAAAYAAYVARADDPGLASTRARAPPSSAPSTAIAPRMATTAAPPSSSATPSAPPRSRRR